MLKLTRQSTWNCKYLCHNHDYICEVDGNGEIIDDYPFYNYLGRYEYE